MRYRWFSSVLLMLGVLGLALGCQSSEPPLEKVLEPLAVSAQPSPMTKAPLPDNSVYHLQGNWQDQNGGEFSLLSLRGRPQVLALIYGGCQGACPRIIEEIRQVESTVAHQHPGQAGFVLVTMDPEVDSPERLQALAKEYSLGPQWTLLRGSPGQVRELAALLGVKYRKISETDYAHSNTISVLSTSGVVLHQKADLGGVDSSAKALEKALSNKDACCE